MEDFNDWVSSLNEDPEPLETKKTDVRKRFPCGQCAGTGHWVKGVNSHGNSKCFACKGKGYFLTDPRKLAKQREARATKRMQAKLDAMKANTEQLVFSEVASMTSWNSFAASVMQQHNEGKEWSEKQVEALERMVAKVQATRQRKAEEAERAKVSVDLSAITDMFEQAKNRGYKRPKYRAEGLTLSLAPLNGVNAGAIYVKTEDDDYCGKVVNNEFIPARNVSETVGTALLEIAKNPADAAVRYGRLTGRCACCGRSLSNKRSIELGIGPICADKWGFL